MSTLDYFGCVNIAQRLVTESYSDAQLYEVQGTPDPPETAGITSIQALNHLKCVFNTFEGGKQGTAFIESTDQWGEFDAVEHVGQPWLQDRVINWPPAEDIMPPTKAYDIMKADGYTQPFQNMTFRWPLYPGIEEPKYMFAMGNFQYVIVGAISGKIETEGF